MASSDARPIPIKNTAFRAVFPILDADGDLVTGATGLDSEVSKDQGTFADCTNEATEIATSSGIYYLDLTSTEMNADCVAVIVKTTSSGAKTTTLVFYPEETGDINVDVTAWLGTAAATPTTAGVPEVDVTHWLGTAAATPTVAGVPEVDLTHVGGATTNVAALATNVDAILTDTGTTLQGELDGIQAVVGALTDAAADGAVTTTDTVVSYLKQIINTLEGAPGIPTWPASAAPGNAVSIAEAIRQIYDNLVVVDDLIDTEIAALPTAAAIADAVWDEDATAHQTQGTFGQAIGDPGADTDTIWAITNAQGATGAGLSAIPWNAAWDAEIESEATDALNAYDPPTRTEATSDKDAILAKLPAALVSGRIDASVGAMAANVINDDTFDTAQGLLIARSNIGSTGNDTTHLHLNIDGERADDDLNSYLLVINDVSGNRYARWIEDYVGATSLATVAALPFTPSGDNDVYQIYAIRADVTGGSGLDAAGVRAAIGLASANLDTQLTAIDDYLDTEVGAIKTVTDAIGATGTGLSAIPWNAAWDAEVQSEVDDALVAQNLDHLVKSAVDTNFATTVHLDSVIGQLADAGGTATFDRTTDALEVLGAGVVVGSMAANSVTASALATDAVNEIVDQVWREAIADHSGTAGSVAELLDNINSLLATQNSSINTINNNVANLMYLLTVGETAVGATGNDTTHVHLDGLTFGDDELNDHLLVIYDDSAAEFHARWILDWVLSTELATVATLPFTPATGDYFAVVAARQDVTGGSGLDAAGVRAAVGLASANLDTQLADIEGKVDDLETRLGTPSDLGSGATIAANLVDIEGQTDDIGVAGAGLTSLASASAMVSVESNVLTLTSGIILGADTIGSTGNDTTHVHLVGLLWPDDQINDHLLVFIDQSAGVTYTRWIEDWVLSTELATLDEALPATPENATDTYTILAIRRDVTGGSGLDAAGVRAAIGLASANLDTQLADIEGKVDDLETRLGTPSDLGSGATIAANLVDIEGQTDDIGVAGAGLTALATAAELAKVPKSDGTSSWNATALAAIQSEANDALVANKLDHLVAVADADDPVDDSIIAKLASKGATADWSSYVNTTDSLEANRDNIGTAGAGLTAADDAAITAIGGLDTKIDTIDGNVDLILADTADMQPKLGTPAGASISADILTIDNLVDDLESRLGTPSNLGSGATVAANLADIEAQTDDIGVAGAGLTEAGGTGDHLTGVPWNAAWDAEVESEATDALNAYDPPTKTEMDSAIAAGDDAVLAAIAALENLSASGAANAVGALVIEGAVTLIQSLRLANSANAGKVSGAATSTVVLRNLADSIDRITATVDADGNRTAVTTDLS